MNASMQIEQDRYTAAQFERLANDLLAKSWTAKDMDTEIQLQLNAYHLFISKHDLEAEAERLTREMQSVTV